jgi:hypothetical protein
MTDGFHGSSQTVVLPKLGFLHLQEKHKHHFVPSTRPGWGLARPQSLHLSTIPVASVVYYNVPSVFQQSKTRFGAIFKKLK